jgi:small neutral amino acid transporter SnatA (MarC family)
LFAIVNVRATGYRRKLRETGKAMSEHASDVAVFQLAIPLMAAGERSQLFCCSPANAHSIEQLFVLIVVVVVDVRFPLSASRPLSWSHAL